MEAKELDDNPRRDTSETMLCKNRVIFISELNTSIQEKFPIFYETLQVRETRRSYLKAS